MCGQFSEIAALDLWTFLLAILKCEFKLPNQRLMKFGWSNQLYKLSKSRVFARQIGWVLPDFESIKFSANCQVSEVPEVLYATCRSGTRTPKSMRLPGVCVQSSVRIWTKLFLPISRGVRAHRRSGLRWVPLRQFENWESFPLNRKRRTEIWEWHSEWLLQTICTSTGH